MSTAVGVDVSSFKKIPNLMRRLQGRAELTADQALAKLANSIKTKAVMNIQRGTKTGHIYGNHQASAPGEAPASDTGKLASSIQISKQGAGVWYISARAPYAAALEFGTERMEARPFMTPAFVETMPNLKDELWKAWKEHKDTLSKGE